MNRVKLPGKLKYKKILLAFLVVISIVILLKVRNENKSKQITNEVNINDELSIDSEQKEDEKLVNEQKETDKNLEQEEKKYDEIRNDFSQGNYEIAINKANELINEFPDSYKGYTIRGIAKAYAGNFSDGMNDIDKALEIKPDYGYALYNKALNYELYDKFDEALEWYDKALQQEEYMWSYYGKASIYGRRGDVTKTVTNLKKALEIANKEGQYDGMKSEAKTEKDFDPVRGKSEFEELIK